MALDFEVIQGVPGSTYRVLASRSVTGPWPTDSGLMPEVVQTGKLFRLFADPRRVLATFYRVVSP